MDADPLDYICYMIAAAIITPIGWWIKEQEVFGFGEWAMSWIRAAFALFGLG